MNVLSTRWWATSLVLIGLILLGSAGWHLITLGTAATPLLHRAIDILLVGGAGIGFLYGGYWHTTRSIPTEQYPRIVAWIVGSTLLFASLTVISLYVGSDQVTPSELLETIHPIGSIGLLAGLLVGTIHAKSIVNAEAAARAEAKAEALHAEQERMEHLNDLLRHYILNGVNIIIGYTSQLRPVVQDDKQAALDTITDRAESMATLIRHLRAVQNGDRAAETKTDLASVLASATVNVRSRSDVVIEAPDTATMVQTNEMVKEAITLLCDAIITATDKDGTLTMTYDHTDQTVTLTLTAAPAELPQSVEDSLFEPIGSGINLKFYLAKQLLDDYGDLHIGDSTGETLCFNITLDAASEA